MALDPLLENDWQSQTARVWDGCQVIQVPVSQVRN